MKHAGPAALDRLDPLLAEIRTLPGLVEKGRGVFYRRGKAFLHFHEDPAALFAPWEALRARAQIVLDQASGQVGHIFNLGHGILPETPVENVKRLVDFVHTYTAQR